MKFNFDFSNRYKLFFAIISLGLIVLLPILSSDAGLTDDERLHMAHGERILDFYLGKDSLAIANPFNAQGIWLAAPNVFIDKDTRDGKVSMNVYGGFFDGLASFLYKYLASDSTDKYQFKHGVSAIFGALLIILTGLLAYKISDDWRIAFLTLVIAALTPRIIGHSLNNPKDIPFATFFVLGLYQVVAYLKELPRIKIIRLIMLALSIGMAIAVRPGAVILIGYLFLFAAVLTFLQLWAKEITWMRLLQVAAITAVVGFAGYLSCALFWPWAMKNPLLNPYLALVVFKNFNNFNSIELFEGRWINNNEIPWYFVPRWFYITFPVALTIGSVLFLILLPKILRTERTRVLLYLLIIFSIVFPLYSIIANKSNIYDDCRHVLFVVPGFIVMAGVSWSFIFKSIKDALLKLTMLIVFGWMLYEPLSFMVRNHPLEVVYFSPIIGGVKDAFKNYEIDYWGFSVRPAMKWIEENDTTLNENHKARVRMWYGEQLKLKHYADKSNKVQYVAASENSTDWDYYIQLPVEAKFNNDLLYHWPPKGTIHQVMADSTPICAIVKNWRVAGQQMEQQNNNAPAPQNGNPVNQLLNSGLSYYNAKNFNAAIVEFKRAWMMDPRNQLLINNIVASLNELGMYDEAIEYGTMGLKINPSFELLKNNLAVSYKGKQSLKYSEQYFMALSYNYFVQREFEKSILAAKQILKYNPKNSIAYNNICSAYNELGAFDKALDACNKGLQLVPADQRMQNNRDIAQKGLNGKK